MINLSKLWGVNRKVKIGQSVVTIPYAIKLDRLGIPLERWIKQEGYENTVKRMKALRIWALKILMHDQNYSSPWITKRFYRGFSIPNYPLFKQLVDAYYSKNFKIIRHLLAILTSYKLYKPSIGSLSSVIDPPRITLEECDIHKLLLYVDLPRIPKSVLSSTKAVLVNSVHAINGGKTVKGPMGSPDLDVMNEMVQVERTRHNTTLWSIPLADSLGRLSVVPDKGKPRTILIGHWELQLRTKRLADYLREYLWTLPEIASGNQQKMEEFIKKYSPTKFMMSLDQSQATDRLSRDFQISILVRMGVPRNYFDFLELPFYYRPKDFGLKSERIRKGYYSNGQPMGLYLSFPMFELAHFVCAKYAVATTNSLFSICGDDIVFACNSKEDGAIVEQRYVDVIESLGGKIEPTKSVYSPLIEGVGQLFYCHPGGNLINITSPSGSISAREASLDTYLNSQIRKRTPVGRAVLYSWLSPKETHEYTYKDRRKFWKWLLSSKYNLSEESYRYLFRNMGRMPQTWSWDQEAPTVLRQLTSPLRKPTLRFVSETRLKDALLTTKIKSLFKERKEPEDGSTK